MYFFKMMTYIGLPAFISSNEHIKKIAITTTIYHHLFLKERTFNLQ